MESATTFRLSVKAKTYPITLRKQRNEITIGQGEYSEPLVQQGIKDKCTYKSSESK
jgi:hypothetical protein